MLSNIFATVLQMSLTATVVIAAVLLARGILTQAPKRYSYLLWLIVAIRLLCPVGISSSVSLLNLFGEQGLHIIDFESFGTAQDDTSEERSASSANSTMDKTASNAVSTANDAAKSNTDNNIIDGTAGRQPNASHLYDQDAKNNSMSASEINGNTVISGQDNTIQSGQRNHAAPAVNNRKTAASGTENSTEDNSVINHQQPETMENPFLFYGAFVWLGIALLLFCWNILLMIRVKKNVSAAICLEGNIYECDNIPSPFVMGIFSPKIYIPFRLGEEEKEYIILHEQHHIQRRDNIIKTAAFFLTCLYWFHPLVWLSYFLMNRDMEMSCDEYVISHFLSLDGAENIRTDYSRSLLGFALNERNLSAGLLSFSETDTRRRVKRIMTFHQCKKWISASAIVLFTLVGMSCLTNARQTSVKDDAKTAQTVTTTAVSAQAESDIPSGESTAKALAEQGWEENQYALLASARTKNGEVALVLLSGNKAHDIEKNPSSGYFSSTVGKKNKNGDYFALVSSKSGSFCDKLNLTTDQYHTDEIFFPAKGIHLTMADYDGDGEKNDFTLGQGLGWAVEAGNFMNYAFFGIDSDGSLINYLTSTENRNIITTLPGEYSKKFTRKKGEVYYTALKKEGGTEKDTTSICRKIPLAEAEKKELSPLHELYASVQETMPWEVLNELEKKGVWTVIHAKGGRVDYLLGNDDKEPTLRLDFYCDANDRLINYVSKGYGFVDSLKPIKKNSDTLSSVIAFADKFWNITLAKGKRSKEKTTSQGDFIITESTITFQDGKRKANRVAVWETTTPLYSTFDDSSYAYYCDSNNNYYVVDRNQGMVVFAETPTELELDPVGKKNYFPDTLF